MEKPQSTHPTYSVKTFGCKVNTYDSALIQQRLKGSLPKKRTHIINTCAVTAEAVKEAQYYIRNYRRQHPQDKIVVTGCAAQVETDKFSSLKEVDLVIANSHKAELPTLIKENSDLHNKQTIPQVFKNSIFKKSELGIGGSVEKGKTRLFLKIQDGCDSFCTFCIIPFARGKSRSILAEDLACSVQKHYDQGVREVVLTGVHIGDYKDSSGKDLGDLLTLILKKTNMPRIRLSSLEPPELNDKLFHLFSDPRVCLHFHLSIQSVNTEVLQQMKRQYTAKQVTDTLIKIQKHFPSAFVGMDVIAGFATETQEQFEDTYSNLKNHPWTKIHVFPYSPRRYTYAEKKYPHFSRSLAVKRASLLRHLSENRLNEQKKKQIGSVKSVLPLKYKEGMGLSKDYWTVLLSSDNMQGEEVLVRVNSIEKSGLRATPLA